MHETMMRRLNALDVFYKGGQRAVEEFMKLSLTGIERSKANAPYKARSSQPTTGPSRKGMDNLAEVPRLQRRRAVAATAT
jgi:hypothetical protein